ncbi:SH3 and multiple ankyrin repeat domains protein 1-like [Passer montanus]|uniref:SH3 and multiple ankyrin repeat domains protein 1-like n=1 Tax=Passer montanus TaxID=9160 RepID=UPI00195FCB6C|nr:SH3 and multiple ankyrin repeat domains protein 1-like [Passer montanus]
MTRRAALIAPVKAPPRRRPRRSGPGAPRPRGRERGAPACLPALPRSRQPGVAGAHRSSGDVGASHLTAAEVVLFRLSRPVGTGRLRDGMSGAGDSAWMRKMGMRGASPQQASAKASRGPSWESRPTLRARASPPARSWGRRSSAGGGFPASPPPGPLPKVLAWPRHEGPRHASFSERGFHAGASSVRCSPSTELPRWWPEGRPLCPGAVPAPRTAPPRGAPTAPRSRDQETGHGGSEIQPTLFWGAKPLRACPTRAFPVLPPRPSLSRPALRQVLPAAVAVLRAAPPAPQRHISRPDGNHSYRSSTAASGGGQNPLSPAEPPAVPPAPSPAERTPAEAQLGAARSAAGAFRAAADSTSSSSPSLLALSLIPLLKHPPLPSPPVERSAGERGASARPPVLSPRRCPPRAPALVATQVRAAGDVKETVMWPLSGGADPAGLEVSPAFLSFSLLA